MRASPLLVGAFVALPLAVTVALVAGSEWAGRRLGEDAARRRRWRLITAGSAAGWLAGTAAVAQSGLLRWWDVMPPPFPLLVAAIVAAGPLIAFSPLGDRLVRGLPLAALVGVQSFRLPLELAMHRAAVEGVMPIQMSYEGLNLDILTGMTAAALGGALAWRPLPRWVVAGWNVLGFGLLVNIVTIAVLSTPIVRWFGDDRLNVWVTYPPFVWLPAVMVTAAWAGHLLVWRALGRPPA